jgi:arsenate reductase (glutaredoxin)
LAKDFPVTIYHRPQCSTSREVLAMIVEAGHSPEIIDYSKVGFTRDELEGLLAALGKTPRDLLRVKGTPAEELGLTKPGVRNATILKAMLEHPILVERPIVKTPKGVILARPKESVLTIL